MKSKQGEFMSEDFEPSTELLAAIDNLFSRPWGTEQMLAENRSIVRGTTPSYEMKRMCAWLFLNAVEKWQGAGK